MRAAAEFANWCQQNDIHELRDIEPVHVAADRNGPLFRSATLKGLVTYGRHSRRCHRNKARPPDPAYPQRRWLTRQAPRPLGLFSSRTNSHFPCLLGSTKLVMKLLFRFALALLAAGYPYMGAILVVAIAIRLVRPIRLTLSVGGLLGKRG